MRASVLSDWLAQRLDRGSGQPIYRQLHGLLQHAILSRELPAGTKVPSSRLLAAELGVGRNTVTQVYEQLALEGYVSSATGRGTFVADSAPDEIVFDEAPARIEAAPAVLSARGERLIEGAGVSKRQGGAFMPGVPDVSRFPARVWSRLHAKYWRRLRPDLLTYAPGGGLASLRHALADYLRTSRSVRCSPEQIIVTTGIHQSIDLAVRLLSDAGDTIWTEDPCYWGVRSVLTVSGLDLKAIPVDEEGIAPSADDLANPPKLMLVTPSHQYPLGGVMPYRRRVALLDWAARADAWIVEDDYDSEFRFAGRPLEALKALDEQRRVLYVATCSKVMFPALRIGYAVVPPALVEPLVRAKAIADGGSPVLEQDALADFIGSGDFERHLRRSRTRIGARRAALLAALAHELGDAVEVCGANAGMHLVAWLRDVPAAQVGALCRAAAEVGVGLYPVSPFYDAPPPRAGLLLGYAALEERDIRIGVERLARLVSQRRDTRVGRQGRQRRTALLR